MSGTQYKNTRGEVVMNIYAIIKRLSVLGMLVFLSGCLDNLKLTNYAIEYPVNNATYIGHDTMAPPAANAVGTSRLAGKIEISFETPISGLPKVVLNGHNIANASGVEFTANRMTIPTDSVYRFLRQGRNTLSVEPNAFGPTINFNYDGMGPTVIIDSGVVSTVGSDKNLHLKGYLRDFSALDSVLDLELISITGYNGNGTIQRTLRDSIAVTIRPDGSFDQNINLGDWLSDSPLLYKFTARDAYGYKTSIEFIADTADNEPMKLKNAIRVAVGDTFITSMRPVIANAVYSTLKAAPIDMRCYNAVNGNNLVTSGSGSDLCQNWNDNRSCGKKRGVIVTGCTGRDCARSGNSRNITQEEFDKLDLENSNVEPPVKDGVVTVEFNNALQDVNISHQFFNCDNAAGDRFYKDDDYNKDGGKLNGINQPIKVTISPLPTMNAYVQEFYMHDGKAATVGGVNLLNKVGTVLLNKFDIKEGDRADLDMSITEMVVRLEIPGGLNVALGMYIGNIVIASEVIISKSSDNGQLKVAMDEQKSNFVMRNVKLDDAKACIKIIINICVPLDGLANLLMPMLEGLIADMLPVIINPILSENLQKIVIGGTLTQPDNQTEFDATLDIARIGTESFAGIYDLKVSLDSLINVTKPDPYNKPILGPVFFDDPINPADVFNGISNGANLTVAVNSNLLNSMLAAMHATGVTFFTFHEGKTYYGAHPNVPAVDPLVKGSPTLASKGDRRIRLWPDMPPVFKLSPAAASANASRAEITFDAATLYQDVFRKKASSSACVGGLEQEIDGDDYCWQNDIEIQVDFNLGVEIGDDGDGRFTFGASEPPVFNINKIINRTSIQVPTAIIQSVFDVAMSFGGNILADQFFTFDFNKMVADNLNGTTVKFLSDKDEWTIPNDSNDNQCIVYENGVAKKHPASVGLTNTGDGKYDVVCYTLQFNVETQRAGTTGNKDTNLFFQMGISDQSLPPPPGMPKMDLDNDVHYDYKDNCSVPIQDLEAAMITDGAGFYVTVDGKREPDMTKMVESNGDLKSGARSKIINALNDIYTQRFGALTAGDIDWYNSRRAQDGDPAVSSGWVEVLYSNPSQRNTIPVNGELTRIGNLCQGDLDRDGIIDSEDNCPGVWNPDQEPSSLNSKVGSACHVADTYVLIQSLGSISASGSGGVYWCLTHSNYKNTTGGGTVGSASYSADMDNRTANKTVAKCDPADLNQRWYLKAAGPNPTGMGANARVYQIFADPSRNNTTSWQLGAYAKTDGKDGHLKMVKMGDATSYVTSAFSSYVVDTRWVMDIDPTAEAGSAAEQIHPWILRPAHQDSFNRANCLFYNQNGWGPDFDRDICATSYSGSDNGGKSNDLFRWGIFIQGSQLWDSSY